MVIGYCEILLTPELIQGLMNMSKNMYEPF